MAGILSLDLSASGTGWALLRSPGEFPVSGTQRLKCPGGYTGATFHALRVWLEDIITLEKPRLVAYEAPRPVMGGASNFNAIFTLYGLAAVTEETCEALGVPKVRKCHVGTIRKHFCGTGNAQKEHVMEICRRLKWRFVDHNAADALAQLHYVAHCEKVPGFGAPPFGLFSAKGAAE